MTNLTERDLRAINQRNQKNPIQANADQFPDKGDGLGRGLQDIRADLSTRKDRGLSSLIPNGETK
ncbi:hypothetical protein [Gulosibacter molinativorax]|uniref:Uncharacterized protein n=1 Tax=Gulosibacter molinativorax TaxID=256821 RepID=A0ABT7C9B4_9MICO|nr:hypothetical protein [Gulosibacter molinativorax]MDJ1371782.1 hypothetical protein [Gulosibacter molinativorax]QUY60847.1 Hypotetical protein [Gulosibacter molinativorax]